MEGTRLLKQQPPVPVSPFALYSSLPPPLALPRYPSSIYTSSPPFFGPDTPPVFAGRSPHSTVPWLKAGDLTCGQSSFR